jgi:uncharacterized damage-inducible protein DinB
MYQTIDNFLNDWKNESQLTLKVLKALTDQSLSQKVSPDGRTLGFLAWHIVLTLGEMGNKTGITVDAPPEKAPEPSNVAAISQTYEKAAQSVANYIRDHWNDSSLQWKRGTALSALVKHEIHHRAQMTILMRQAKIPVPGVYGPSKEEWSQYGMPPMK